MSPRSDFWRSHFLSGCAEAGVDCLEVPEVDWLEGILHPPGPELKEWRARTWNSVLSFVRSERTRAPVDLFLSYLFPDQIEPAAVDELNRLGVATVNFFCDNVREFRKVPDCFKPFALHWVPEFEALTMYRKAGLPHLHAAMPCWVPAELRSPVVRETHPPTFIGTADQLRRDLLGNALERGADLEIRGWGWSQEDAEPKHHIGGAASLASKAFNQFRLVKQHGPWALYYKVQNRLAPVEARPIPATRIKGAIGSQADYLRISREAEVTIGVNRVPTTRAPDRKPISYSRLRDIEAPMLAACYLTEWTAGLAGMFDLGTEIETYRSADELVSKLEWLRGDRDRRASMRVAAQRRALECHSVPKTMNRIRDYLGLHEPRTIVPAAQAV